MDGTCTSQRNLGKDVGKVAKYKWTPRADLVQDWRMSLRYRDAMNKVNIKCVCVVVHANFTI